MSPEVLNQIYALQIALAATLAHLHTAYDRTPHFRAARELRRRLREFGA